MASGNPTPTVAAVIPAYCEERYIAAVVAGVLKYLGEVIVIDDGSPDSTASKAREAGAEVIRHVRNEGKGAALKTGLRVLESRPADYFLVLDGDGQHDPDDIPNFFAAISSNPSAAVFCGNRMGNIDTMPLVRRWTNQYMSGRVSRACQQIVPDTQCGFRLYRRDTLPHLLCETNKFDYETEVLLLIARHGLKIDSVTVKTIYGDEKSKIHPLRDAIRFFRLMDRYQSSSSAGGNGSST
ncbi:MAG TPA: glycosyltransferase family 2 protein [Chthoniobacterales bacterium]